MKVLIAEHDPALRETVRRALVTGGHDVVLATDGHAAVARISDREPDCVVLDDELDGIDAREICRQVRHGGNHVPILMLTTRDAIGDRIESLEAGADDCLARPFDVGELQARLRALSRRRRLSTIGDVSFAELRLDVARHGVVVDPGTFVELSRTEFRLLEILLRRAGGVVPHALISERVWEYESGPASDSLRVYVGYLRRKLGEAGARDLIHTVRGVGYSLREP